MSAPETNATAQVKKPYSSPLMYYYGTIRTITKNVGMTGFSDGGGGSTMNSKP